MEFSPKIAEQIDKLPPELRKVLDAEIAAGNGADGLEFGRGPDRGKVAIVLNYPFRTKEEDAPAGVLYRESIKTDPMFFEFYMTDGLFSLVCGKFKPMKLDPLPPGPENPTEAHIKRMEAIHARDEAAAKERAKKVREPVVPPLPPRPAESKAGGAFDRFVSSMVMTFDMWHDGLGYDLDAIKELTPAEKKSVESILINHSPRDWRDIEALAQFDTDAARKAVEAGLKSSDPHVRQTAMDYAREKVDPRDRERLLIQSLNNDDIYGGLTQSIDEVPDFHPPAVIDALFEGALNRDGGVAVHFAALLFFLHGKAKEPFDWDHRPFFLRFHTTDRAERKAVFRELCEIVGVDPKKYLR